MLSNLREYLYHCSQPAHTFPYLAVSISTGASHPIVSQGYSWLMLVYTLTPTNPSKFAPRVSGSRIFCQTKPGLPNWEPRFVLVEDSRTIDFRIRLFVLILIRMPSSIQFIYLLNISCLNKYRILDLWLLHVKITMYIFRSGNKLY